MLNYQRVNHEWRHPLSWGNGDDRWWQILANDNKSILMAISKHMKYGKMMKDSPYYTSRLFFLLWCSMQLPSTVPLIILKLSEGFYHGNLHEMACTKWINGKPCEQNHHHHHHHPKIEKIKGHPIHPTSGSCRRKLATSKRRGSQPPSFRT